MTDTATLAASDDQIQRHPISGSQTPSTVAVTGFRRAGKTSPSFTVLFISASFWVRAVVRKVKQVLHSTVEIFGRQVKR